MTGLLTETDYRRCPEGPPWPQLVAGELVQDPSPSLPHQDIAGNLFALLRAHVLENRLGKVIIAPMDVYLTVHNVFQPDVLFVRSGRLGIVREDGVYGAPDFAVEIVSRWSERRDRDVKRRVYAQAGVQEYWVIDPIGRTMEVFDFRRSAEEPAWRLGECSRFTSPLFPGLTIDCAEIFRR